MPIEVGTSSNPLLFPDLVAGTTTVHPDSPIDLWNDRGGLLNSKPAKNVAVQIVEMYVADEILGTSDGGSSQTFTAVLAPVLDNDPTNPIVVEVDGTEWTRVANFTGQPSSAEVYTFDAETGLVTFGDGAEGKIPPLGDEITITYTPDDNLHGSEVTTRAYIGVRSTGVIANSVTVNNESQTSTDTTHVTVLNKNITGVTKVVLASDPGGIDYFSGGTFDNSTGEITLSFALPNPESEVLVTYTHTIVDDTESDFTFLAKGDQHQFTNPIPSNCAKRLDFSASIPGTASPTGGTNVKFRIRILYEG